MVGGWWSDGIVVIERLCLSLPFVEKLFNSKVIKSFVPELRSRQVFFFYVSGFLLSIYELLTFYVHFTRIHIMGKLQTSCSGHISFQWGSLFHWGLFQWESLFQRALFL